MMKRIWTAAAAALMMLTLATGCFQKKDEPNTIKDGKKLTDVVSAVDQKFVEKYGSDAGVVVMGMDTDEMYLTDFAHLDMADVEDYAGRHSMSMTNSDTFIAVKAKDGKVDVVKEALEKRKQDLIAQYEQYPVNGSYERAQSGEIYVKGNYVFLIVVGMMPDDPDAPIDFSEDIALVKSTIDSMFN